MSQSVNVGGEDPEWVPNRSPEAKPDKKPDPLQALLWTFRESVLIGDFQNRFYVLIIDPTSYKVEKRAVLDLNLRTLDHYVIIDNETSCCYCPSTLDAGTRQAITTYCGRNVETIPMSSPSWQQAQDQFQEHAAATQKAYHDGTLTSFYDQLARERAAETQRIEREIAEAQKKRNEAALKKLTELLADMQGDSRFQKLCNFLAEMQRKEAERNEEELKESEKKEAQDLKELIQEEIKKEEIKRDTLKELVKDRSISIDDKLI